jgi:hypothetical protein
MEGITTIQVSRDARDRLAKFGEAGESLNTALLHVLNIAEESLCVAATTCAICGKTMPSSEYEEKGCVYCGADSEA